MPCLAAKSDNALTWVEWRAYYHVALGGGVVAQGFAYVGVLGHVPCVHVDRDAVVAQTVARHEHATIVFHHALAVAILVVQRQHHPHPNGFWLGVGHGLFLRRVLCRRLWLCGCCRRERYEDVFALLQFIPRLLHLGIGVEQLLDGQSVVFGYPEYSLLALHLVYLAPLCGLRHGHVCSKG